MEGSGQEWKWPFSRTLSYGRDGTLISPSLRHLFGRNAVWAFGPTSRAAFGSHVVEKLFHRCQGHALDGKTPGLSPTQICASWFIPSNSMQNKACWGKYLSDACTKNSRNSLSCITPHHTQHTPRQCQAVSLCCGCSQFLKTVFGKIYFYSQQIPEVLKFFSSLVVYCNLTLFSLILFLFESYKRKNKLWFNLFGWPIYYNSICLTEQFDLKRRCQTPSSMASGPVSMCVYLCVCDS